jgi:5'-3' exonuclease
VKVHLVDGTYELFRAFYGAPAATTGTGREVGAARALARSLLALVRSEGATHVAVAFDSVIESFRNELFAGYKTGAGIDPALASQFPLAEQVAASLGFVVWPMFEFEADDALASGAARFAADPRVEAVLIASPDKDLMQCVRGDRVVLLDRRRRLTYDERGVREKLGIEPRSVPDYLALVGDAADGIPGIPRWGEKSARTVLAVHPSLEEIPRDARDWAVALRGREALAESLAARSEDARLYRTLATLRSDAPLVASLEDLEWTGADRGALTELSRALEDPGLLERVPRFREG